MALKSIAFDLPQRIPLLHEAEILVVGGGPGGIGAAVSAARAGQDVLLAEHYGFLGGMASAGEVNPFMPNHLNGDSLDHGICTEWLDRIRGYGGLRYSRTIDPNAVRLAAEDLCLEAGVRLLFHHRVAHAGVKARRITGIALHSKSGLTGAKASLYIDGTGDGDLASLAGCAFELGGEGTPHAQPMTLCFKVKLDERDVSPSVRKDPKRMASEGAREWLGPVFDRIQEVYRKAKKDGRIQNPRENVLIFRAVDPWVLHFNTTRVVQKSAIKGAELSQAELEARRQIRQMWQVFREEIPLFKRSRICSIATQIGIRESRRVLGRAIVTRQDYMRCAKFPDGIARVTYPIDIHSPTGTGTEITHLPPGEWYEIPYGCLVPRDIDNLLMACRAISVDHAVHSSVRVMPPIVSIGQAAGTAAAMARKAGVKPAELDGKKLRKRLIRDGRNL